MYRACSFMRLAPFTLLTACLTGGVEPGASADGPEAAPVEIAADERPLEVTSMYTVTSADGTRIAVHRTGSGPPLVLVHGTTADHTRWARVLPMFARHFTVHAVDRRGRGGSGDGDSYSLGQEGEDIAAVVDSIDEPVNLLGHSYGAACAIEAALRTQKLRTLILYEPPLPGAGELVSASTRQRLDDHIARGEREEALLLFFREVVLAPESQVEMLRTHPAWQGRIAAAHTLPREIRIESEYDLDVERLRTVRVPTLLLLGGDSPPDFGTTIRRLHDVLPDSRVHVMPGQQHVAMDTASEMFVAAVTEFIQAAR